MDRDSDWWPSFGCVASFAGRCVRVGQTIACADSTLEDDDTNLLKLS